MSGRNPRGTCPECGQAVPLYRGTLRSHQRPATALRPADTCPGGTRQPGPVNGAALLTFDGEDTPAGDSRDAYTRWFLGDHKGIAPPWRDRAKGEPVILNGMDSVVNALLTWRREILDNMNPDEYVIRDDQFAVFLQLADDLGEAIDELLAIGWPAQRKDGTVVWEAVESRPVAAAEAANWQHWQQQCAQAGRTA